MHIPHCWKSHAMAHVGIELKEHFCMLTLVKTMTVHKILQYMLKRKIIIQQIVCHERMYT